MELLIAFDCGVALVFWLAEPETLEERGRREMRAK